MKIAELLADHDLTLEDLAQTEIGTRANDKGLSAEVTFLGGFGGTVTLELHIDYFESERR